MGIRMLNRRPVPSRGRGGAGPVTSRGSAPVFASAAGTARVPTGPVDGLRRSATELRARLARVRGDLVEPESWYLWAGLLRGHLTTALAHLPRPDRRRGRGLTVFVAAPVSPARPRDRSAGD
ncbi:hypothetical protein ABTX35_07085 [Streptomyces sp. NPDC096080]|uniref:hypothetical protein n=1 Tax=Streptomyces sp. NPDC096080 TaxID=3156693 RepID=UPI0033275833